MGLDMYLQGHKYIWRDYENPENEEKEDGFRVCEHVLELGYWRKHPNLHGYIVENYAGGEDNCQEIMLSIEALDDILLAVEEDRLPHTTGFFFGESLPEDKKPTIKMLRSAIRWLDATDPKTARSVVYHASW